MKLIVGLGNPGQNYKYTRHNIGYRIVEKLAEEYKAKFKRSYIFKSLIAQVRLDSELMMCVLPFTFMNLSGAAVGKIVRRRKISLEDILVVCDDIDSIFGKIRIRPSGSYAGHQGLRSVIENLKTNEFARLKIGVGRPEKKEDVVNFVLSKFTKQEEAELDDVINKAVDCCQVWLKDGIVKTMDKFN